MQILTPTNNIRDDIQGGSGGNGYTNPVHIPPTGENGYGEITGCKCKKCILIKK